VWSCARAWRAPVRLSITGEVRRGGGAYLGGNGAAVWARTQRPALSAIAYNRSRRRFRGSAPRARRRNDWSRGRLKVRLRVSQNPWGCGRFAESGRSGRCVRPPGVHEHGEERGARANADPCCKTLEMQGKRNSGPTAGPTHARGRPTTPPRPHSPAPAAATIIPARALRQPRFHPVSDKKDAYNAWPAANTGSPAVTISVRSASWTLVGQRLLLIATWKRRRSSGLGDRDRRWERASGLASAASAALRDHREAVPNRR
jgi:hypothetical protein